MQCEDVRNHQILYLKNELNPHEKKQFEKHLTDCAHCREEYEEIRITDSFLKKYLVPEKSPSMRQISRKKAWMKYALTAAAVLIVGIFLVINQYIGTEKISDSLSWDENGTLELLELQYDYYRINYNYPDFYSLNGSIQDEEFIDNYIINLNDRIDYLNEAKL
jgi:hypothetical protein